MFWAYIFPFLKWRLESKPPKKLDLELRLWETDSHSWPHTEHSYSLILVCHLGSKPTTKLETRVRKSSVPTGNVGTNGLSLADAVDNLLRVLFRECLVGRDVLVVYRFYVLYAQLLTHCL